MHDPALKVPAVPLGIFIRTWPECHELKGGVASARFLRFYLRDVRTMADEADTTAGRGFRGRDVAGQPLTTGLAGTAARLLAGRRGRSPPGLATPRFTTHVVVCAQQCTFRERPQRGDYAQMRVSSRDACPHTATSLPRGRQPGLRRAARRSRAHRGGGILQSYILRPRRRSPALASTSPDIGLGVSGLACPPPPPTSSDPSAADSLSGGSRFWVSAETQDMHRLRNSRGEGTGLTPH